MSWVSRIAATAGRGAVRLVPADRRDWAEAVWAEAHEAPAGWPRLAWRAGGLGLIVKEGQMARTIGSWLLFALAAGAAAWGPGRLLSQPAGAVQGGIIITLACWPASALSRSGSGRPATGRPGGSGSASTPRSWPCCPPRPPSGCSWARSRDQVLTGIPSTPSRARECRAPCPAVRTGQVNRGPGLHGLPSGDPPGADRTSYAGGPGHAGHRRRYGPDAGPGDVRGRTARAQRQVPGPAMAARLRRRWGRGAGLDLAVRRAAGRRGPRGAALPRRGRPRSGGRHPNLAGLRRRGGVRRRRAMLVTVLGTGTTALMVRSAWCGTCSITGST